jgi:hypothetical protein
MVSRPLISKTIVSNGLGYSFNHSLVPGGCSGWGSGPRRHQIPRSRSKNSSSTIRITGPKPVITHSPPVPSGSGTFCSGLLVSEAALPPAPRQLFSDVVDLSPDEAIVRGGDAHVAPSGYGLVYLTTSEDKNAFAILKDQPSIRPASKNEYANMADGRLDFSVSADRWRNPAPRCGRSRFACNRAEIAEMRMDPQHFPGVALIE